MEHYNAPVRIDCEELLTRFQTRGSVRYEHFLEIWKEMDFSSIFHGKDMPKIKRDFSRLVLSVAALYFLPPHTFLIRVGGLYLMYGLFNTQLITPKEKIRIALKDWKNVMQFQEDAMKAQHLDVVYVLHKLLSDKAFCFTAMPIPLFFRERRRDGRETKVIEDFVEPSSRPQDLVSTDMLEELANVHNHYENIKKAVFPISDPSLNLVQQNIVAKLRCAALSYSTWKKHHLEFEQQDPGEGTSNAECSSRAQLLSSIKNKSYGEAVQASKSRRHRQTELVSAFTGEPIKAASHHKKSLKERTEELWRSQGKEDSSSSTNIYRLSSLAGKSQRRNSKRKFNWSPDKPRKSQEKSNRPANEKSL